MIDISKSVRFFSFTHFFSAIFCFFFVFFGNAYAYAAMIPAFKLQRGVIVLQVT